MSFSFVVYTGDVYRACVVIVGLHSTGVHGMFVPPILVPGCFCVVLFLKVFLQFFKSLFGCLSLFLVLVGSFLVLSVIFVIYLSDPGKPRVDLWFRL